MDIPSLDPQGLLPPGIHECSLAQIISTFGRTGVEHRRTFLCGRLEEFLPWVRSVNCFRSLFIDGSFVTDKEEPNDIDMLLELPPASLQMLGHIKNHAVFNKSQVFQRFQIDVFPMAPGFVDLLDWFQGLRVEEAKARGLKPNHKKGILKMSL
jgi:hypothetical protein